MRHLRAAGQPIISVDTKKKELIGNFRNKGKTWCKKAVEVDEHDIRVRRNAGRSPSASMT